MSHFRLHPELSHRLAKHAAKTGKTKTRLVEEGLTVILGQPLAGKGAV